MKICKRSPELALNNVNYMERRELLIEAASSRSHKYFVLFNWYSLSIEIKKDKENSQPTLVHQRTENFIKKKNKLFKKAAGNHDRMIFYRKYRNIYNNLVRQAKSNYYSKRLRDSSHDIKKTWSVLQEIIGKTKTKCSLPTKLNVTNKDFFSLHLEDPIQIADYFNSFFASVGERTSICIDIDPNKGPFGLSE